MKPRLLDLFCGAGGAAMGYHRAGFDVVGVDNWPQPRYPFEFRQGDALELLIHVAVYGENVLHDSFGHVDAIHASPPCQGYSVTASLHDAQYPRLIEHVRGKLQAFGLPYVIENVQGAPLRNWVRLCGSSFGLGVRRHRLFETSWFIMWPPPCAHHLQPEPIDVTGTGGPCPRPVHNGGGIHRKPRNLAQAREAMGIDWMTRAELGEAVPPDYTKWIAERLLEHLEVAA